MQTLDLPHFLHSGDNISGMAVDGETSLAQLYDICFRLGEGEVIAEALYDRLRLVLEKDPENPEHLLDILWLFGMRP